MNRDEAKLILQAYRPGGQDAGDPYFAEALVLVKQDPELAAWFTAEQQFDARVGSGLQQVRVPSRLKAEILAFGQKQESRESPVAAWWRNLFSWQSPVAWAAAVVLVVVLSLALFRAKPEGSSGFAAYSAEMVNTAVNDKHHVDMEASGMKQALAWLATHQGENNLTLPAGLNDDQSLMGCRVLDWHGRKVSMLCYSVKGMEHVDVFVTEANLFPDAPTPDHPQFAVSGGLPTASWTHGGKVYLAISHGNDAVLKNILSAI